MPLREREDSVWVQPNNTTKNEANDRYIVEIGDTEGRSFTVAMAVPFGEDLGSWRTLDKSRIRYNSGALKQYLEGDAMGQYSIDFYGPDGVEAG